jgi:hypothetical protein
MGVIAAGPEHVGQKLLLGVLPGPARRRPGRLDLALGLDRQGGEERRWVVPVPGHLRHPGGPGAGAVDGKAAHASSPATAGPRSSLRCLPCSRARIDQRTESGFTRSCRPGIRLSEMS